MQPLVSTPWSSFASKERNRRAIGLLESVGGVSGLGPQDVVRVRFAPGRASIVSLDLNHWAGPAVVMGGGEIVAVLDRLPHGRDSRRLRFLVGPLLQELLIVLAREAPSWERSLDAPPPAQLVSSVTEPPDDDQPEAPADHERQPEREKRRAPGLGGKGKPSGIVPDLSMLGGGDAPASPPRHSTPPSPPRTPGRRVTERTAPGAAGFDRMPVAPTTANAAVDLPETLRLRVLEDLLITVAGGQVDLTTIAHRSLGHLRGVVGRPVVVRFAAERAIVEPDELWLPFPGAKERSESSAGVMAVATGRVIVWVRFEQDGALLGVITIESNAVEEGEAGATTRRQDTLDADSHPQTNRLDITEKTVVISAQTETAPAVHGTTIDYELHSAGTTVKSTQPVDRPTLLHDLYTRIEEVWVEIQRSVRLDPRAEDGSARSAGAEFTIRLREIGENLAEKLLPPELRAFLHAHRKEIEGITFFTTGAALPWEIVHLSDSSGGNGVFLGELGMVRWLQGTHPSAHLSVSMARARWLIPEYEDPLPFLTNERAFLDKRMRAQPLAPADHTGLVSELTARGFDLLHFAGHGDVDPDEPLTQYLLVDPGATVRYADTEVRAGFLPLTPPPTRTGPIVMLNACRTGELRADHGGFATAFLQGGAEIFVGCRWSVGSRAASSFTSAFYLALRDGATLAQASRRARESARSDDDASWIAYTVYGNPQATVDFVDWTDDHLEETP